MKRPFLYFGSAFLTFVLVVSITHSIECRNRERRAREAILKANLLHMRNLIDQYEADKERLPRSLEELVMEGYMREVPNDAITGKAEWDVEMGPNKVTPQEGEGIVDVHSKATGEDKEGRRYKEY